MNTFKVKNAEVLNRYILKLTFINNEIKLFDIQPYLDGYVFKPLKEKSNLLDFTIDEFGSIECSCGASLSYDTLYICSVPLN